MQAARFDRWINSSKDDFNGDDAGRAAALKEFIFNFNDISYELKEGSNDNQIKALAAAVVGRIEYAFVNIQHLGRLNLIKLMHEMCANLGVKYPSDFDLDGIVARLICVKWWTKKLRVLNSRKSELKKIKGGAVNRNNEIYCSDETLERRGKQLRRNAELLEGVTIQNESGYKMTLSEAAAVGMANPHNRVSELITRLKGFGEIAEKYSHLCVFITLTAPSKYHSTGYNSVTKTTYKNKKYEGFTPSDTQKYMTKQWAKCRASLAREGVQFYGLRVVEPHHDGTPHWHGSIWLKNEGDLEAFKRIVTDYFLNNKECDPEDDGAKENRVKFQDCDKRGAVGYMLKYILKNMRARAASGDSDEGEITSEKGAERVEAWATTWGIRQFQQVGGHSVTVWRELRRVDELELLKREDEHGDSLQGLMRAWRAAQKIADKKANYAEFIEAMGGLEVKPRDSLIKLQDEFVVVDGEYGAAIRHLIHGVIDMAVNFAVKNNRQKWERI